ncbi:hypothetical protein AVEN_249432-1 [Araneus ventricosus]|uniref:Uncharacterized protein n=1 Tax=Araneus ventricosus TaxID=182803 RepID=A0A4Y2TT47_ARAVE|nr:hypothetical protein AVEN_249432-1 [Araneus ventricosus]
MVAILSTRSSAEFQRLFILEIPVVITNKQSPRPDLVFDSAWNHRPPRLHRADHATTPVLLGYDPSSEMGPKSHTTIDVARTHLLIRRLLIREIEVPPDRIDPCGNQKIGMTAAAIASSTEAGVLVANPLATARPLRKEVRRIIGGGTQAPPILYPQGRRVPAYLSGSYSYPCTRSPAPWELTPQKEC